MKKLKDLYLPVQNPVWNDIVFEAAFPEDTEAWAQKLKQNSDESVNPIIEAWQTRLATELSNALDRNLEPPQIVSEVPWLTEKEFEQLVDAVETYIGGDTQQHFALKVLDLGYLFAQLKETAMILLRNMVLQKQQQTKIVTPFNNPDGSTKIVGAGGQPLV